MKPVHVWSEALFRACGSWDPVAALTPVLQCIAHYERETSDTCHAFGMALVALIQLRLGDVKHATILMHAALPKIIEHAPVLT